MKIALIGTGALGSVIGGYLALSGEDVTFVDPNKAHIDAIREKGLSLTHVQKNETHLLNNIRAEYSAYDIGVMDLVIFLVKGLHTAEALEGALPAIGPDTIVCSLQNGVGNWDTLSERVPRERIIYGCSRMTGKMVEPGVVTTSALAGASLVIGELVPNTVTAVMCERLVEAFEKVGINMLYTPDVARIVWTKAMNNSAVNATCALLRLNIANAFNHPCADAVLNAIGKEFEVVARAKGIQISWDEYYHEDFIPMTKSIVREHFPSMAQDMLFFKRKTEIDNLNGAAVRYGKELGIPTPVNEVIYNLVKTIEDNYDKQHLN